MLTPLEQAVIDMLLEKQDEPFNTIRQQLSHATIGERHFTGAGFFTDVVIPADAPIRRDLADMTIGDVAAEFPVCNTALVSCCSFAEELSACWRATHTTSRGPRTQMSSHLTDTKRPNPSLTSSRRCPSVLVGSAASTVKTYFIRCGFTT
jgi:hypothetical protein